MNRTRSTRRKIFIFLVIDAVIMIALLPTIITFTGLGDTLVNSALSKKSMTASTRSVSIGYFSPLSIEGFDLWADDGSLHVEMEAMRCEKSWLAMLLSGGNLGAIQFLEPAIKVVTQPKVETVEPEVQESPEAAAPLRSLPTFVADVDGAQVIVQAYDRPEPAIDLQDLSFTIRTESTEYGTVLSVDPADLLDEQPLTPELCNQGIQLIAPLFADSIAVEGNVSFRIDHCAIPIGDLEPQQKIELTEIDGTVRLTDVSVGLNNQIAQQITSLLSQFFAVDQQIRLTVTRSSEVRFYVLDGRVHHQGLAFLLPIAESDFEFNSSGSVGFDESLDLQLTLALPKDVIGDGPVRRFLTNDPLAIKIVGTTQDPVIRLASDQGWQSRLQQALDAIGSSDGESSPSITDSAGAVLDLVGGLLDRGENADEEASPGLRERLRDRREQRNSEPRRPGILRRRRQP